MCLATVVSSRSVGMRAQRSQRAGASMGGNASGGLGAASRVTSASGRTRMPVVPSVPCLP